jgi:hypothetical protein
VKQITKDLNLLKDNDIINILLFGLYKLKDDPEYSALSELIYVLDKDSLYKLCATYGGTTLKIPTIDELKEITNVLLLFQYINVDKKSFSEACNLIDPNCNDKKYLLQMYNKFVEILENYYDRQS